LSYLDKEKQKASQYKYYLKHKERYLLNTKIRKIKYKNIIDRYKSRYGCCDCSVKHLPPYVYDLHHLEPDTKEGAVSRLIRTSSWERIKNEIKKCIILCSNCHRIRHSDKYTS